MHAWRVYHRPDRLLPQGIGPGVPGDRGPPAAGDVLWGPAVARRRDEPSEPRRGARLPRAAERAGAQRRPPHRLAREVEAVGFPRKHSTRLPATARPPPA